MSPNISRFLGINIYMYKGDHVPPHFHARYNGNDAMIEISSLEMIEGKLPSKVLSLVLERAEMHQEDLAKNRELLEKEGKFIKIKPLI